MGLESTNPHKGPAPVCAGLLPPATRGGCCGWGRLHCHWMPLDKRRMFFLLSARLAPATDESAAAAHVLSAHLRHPTNLALHIGSGAGLLAPTTEAVTSAGAPHLRRWATLMVTNEGPTRPTRRWTATRASSQRLGKGRTGMGFHPVTVSSLTMHAHCYHEGAETGGCAPRGREGAGWAGRGGRGGRAARSGRGGPLQLGPQLPLGGRAGEPLPAARSIFPSRAVERKTERSAGLDWRRVGLSAPCDLEPREGGVKSSHPQRAGWGSPASRDEWPRKHTGVGRTQLEALKRKEKTSRCRQ